jgi:hypothetical protein
MSKTEITEEKVQALADILEDVFYAGRYSDNEADQADWRRVAICALQEANEMNRDVTPCSSVLKDLAFPRGGDNILARTQLNNAFSPEIVDHTGTNTEGILCFYTVSENGPYYIHEEGTYWKRDK